MPRQRLLPAAEAARRLGISLDTLRRWDRDGKIRTRRDAANRRVVPLAEVERLRSRDAHALSARNRFRGASPKYPQDLYARHRCSKPVTFATNTVVLVVPRANPARIRSVYDLRRDGIKLVVGAKGVPIGDYTRRLLANLRLTSVLSNVVSEEDDVKLVVAKVALGEADAA